jgi:diguanylate cyclase (GGDEF)-like protein/PAS domain S-box-containing protein
VFSAELLLREAQSAERKYLLTSDPAALLPLSAAQREVPSAIARVARLTADNPAQQERIRALGEEGRRSLAAYEAIVALHRNGDADAARARVVAGDGSLAEAERLADALRAEEDRLLAAREDVLAASESRTTLAFLLLAALSLGSAVVAARAAARGRARMAEATAALAVSEERFRLLADNASDLVRVQDSRGRPVYVSPSARRLLGYSPEEMLALPPYALLHPDDKERVLGHTLALRDSNAGPLRHRLRHKDGHYLWFETFAKVVRSPTGDTLLQTAARDVTATVRAEEQLARQAEQLRALSLGDELTGLCNRRGFLERSRGSVELAHRRRSGLAVVFIDLNGMKRINDELGHEQGDAALVDTAALLRDVTRTSDVVARLGGDEFVVLLHDVEAEGAQAFAHRLQQRVARFNAEEARPYALSVSVGAAALAPGDRTSLDELLARADAAMYEEKRAKKAGRSA